MFQELIERWALKVKSKIFPAHSTIQMYLMQFLSGVGYPQILWMPCGTKFGKTLAGAASVAKGSTVHRGSTLRIVAPIYRQTKVSYNYVNNMLPGSPFVEHNKADMITSIPAYKNQIEFWSGKNPEDLEGGAVIAQLNDECAKLREQVMISTRTTLTKTRGRVANISTPRGRNWFYAGYQAALKEMAAARREGRIPKEIALTAPTLANPHINLEAVADAKRILSKDNFDQYYRAKFVDMGRVFPVPVVDERLWKAPYEQQSEVEFWLHPDCGSMKIVAGADWAKKNDYTVLTVWDYSKRPFQCVGFLRMNGRRYTEQLVDIVRFIRKFNACDLLLHDQTGLGEVIEDMLNAVPDINPRGLVFSNASKSYMVNGLVAGMERREVEFPWWDNLISEFDTFEVEVSDVGNMKYAAETGSHDDIVFSCCLGFQACSEYAEGLGEINFLEDLGGGKMDRDTVEHYIADMLDIDYEEGF